jgi:hypothetical protein
MVLRVVLVAVPLMRLALERVLLAQQIKVTLAATQ